MRPDRFIVVALAGLLSVPLPARAQYPFGRNKVIYHPHAWKVLETEHVDIYHYPADENLIRFVAPLVEETYEEFSKRFRLRFDRRLPLVLYNTHYDFQQQNILPVLLTEATGGFTDLIRGRIAVPFTGQYGSFRHVVRHEMVHAFMLEKLRRVMHGHGRFSYRPPPLWFVEGMAEYFADHPQNAQGAMFLRDALLHDRLLPLREIWRIQGSFLMYKQGEAVLGYIATSFGEDAIVRILENWWMDDRFDGVLRRTIGRSLDELDAGFRRQMKRRYYPVVMRRRFAAEAGRRLTPPHTFHIHGVGRRTEDGAIEIVSLCARDGALSLCRGVAGAEGGWKEWVLVRGGTRAAFENLPAFRSRIELAGDTLAFVAKSSDRDRIYLWSLSRGRELTHMDFDDLGLISSPTLSGDRRRLVFSAIARDGRMDLYRVDLITGRRERLTDDVFGDEDPDYHPWREEILFASDRDARGRRDRTHIYRMNLETRTITRVEGGEHADSDPEWLPDGRSFLFVSDREGAPNVYEHRGPVIVRQTDVLGGVSAPAILPGGDAFIATTYTDGEFHLFVYPRRDGDAVPVALAGGGAPPSPWSPPVSDTTHYVSRPYRTHFQVDFIGAGVAIDPESGDAGNGGVVAMTDILGDHQIQAAVATTSEDFASFLQSLNAAVTWVDRSRRLNWSVSAFSLNSENFDTPEIGDRETRTGAALGLSYPLDRFRRLDASVLVRRIDRHFFDIPLRRSWTASLFATWVHDATLWAVGGPRAGFRYYVTLGQTLDLQGNGLGHTSVQFDARRYVPLAGRVVLATRVITRHVFGEDDLVFHLGGPWTLRGYRFRSFFGRSTWLANTEIRFPLLDRFGFALPFGSVELPVFRGALFADAGRVTRNRVERRDTDWLGTLGLGVELDLGIAPVVRVNFTRQHDFRTIRPGWGTELFIGFNY